MRKIEMRMERDRLRWGCGERERERGALSQPLLFMSLNCSKSLTCSTINPFYEIVLKQIYTTNKYRADDCHPEALGSIPASSKSKLFSFSF